jgi:hypothetical protein
VELLLLLAESIVGYYGRADRHSEKGPVRVLLKYVVEQQLAGKVNTEMGRKYQICERCNNGVWCGWGREFVVGF